MLASIINYPPELCHEIRQNLMNYRFHNLTIIILTFIISRVADLTLNLSFIVHPNDPQVTAKERIRATNREDIILLSQRKSSRVGRNQIPRRHLHATKGPRPAEGKAKIGPVYYTETSDTLRTNIIARQPHRVPILCALTDFS